MDVCTDQPEGRERWQRKSYEEVVKNQVRSRTIVIPFPCDIC